MAKAKKTANEIVALARDKERFTALEYMESLLDSFVELHGDRLYADDQAVVGGIGLLNGVPVTAIGIQKGRTLPENIERNFGSAHPEGYRKALRLMKQAEKFGRPVITFINTAGAFCGIEAEERGEGEAIARNLLEMSDLKVPTIAIIIGEGGSGGALALALTDEVWMLEHSMYAILSPEGFASIMWKDSKRSAEAAEVMKITASDLKELGIIERIIPEMKENQPLEQNEINQIMKEALIEKLAELSALPTDQLLAKRYQRFRKY